VDLDDDVEIAADEKSGAKRGGLLALIARLGRRFGTHLRRLEARLLRKIPIVRSVARLSTRYGASMAVYFSFCAWLMLNSVMQLLLFLPLLVKHSLNVFMGTTTTTQYESGLGGTTFGIWWAFYSSFPESDGALYTGACSLLILVTMIVSARKFIAERRAAQYIEVYGIGSDKFRFARAVLNGWDISVNSATTASEAHAIAADRLRLLVDEEERAARIAARSIRERNWLLVRRIVGIVISVAYTASAWAVIIGLQLYEQTLAKILVANSVPGASLLSLVGIPILVSAINVVLPVMTMMVTKFERWDDPSTTLRLQVFRLYLGKILNLLINVAGYGILVATQQSELKGLLELPGGLTVQFVVPNDTRFGCAENQVGTMLFIFVGVEFVVDKFVSLGNTLANRYAKPMVMGTPWVREPFPTAQKVINLIYFQALLWLTAPYFPYVMVLGPLCLYTTFKFDEWLLKTMMAKPADPWAADDVGAFFFRIFFATFSVALAWYYLFLRVADIHACGPHQYVSTPWDALETYVNNTVGLTGLYRILLNALVLWVIIGLMILRSSTSDSHKEILQDYADVRIGQLSQQSMLLDAKVRVQERQLAALRRQRGALHGGKDK